MDKQRTYRCDKTVNFHVKLGKEDKSPLLFPYTLKLYNIYIYIYIYIYSKKVEPTSCIEFMANNYRLKKIEIGSLLDGKEHKMKLHAMNCSCQWLRASEAEDMGGDMNAPITFFTCYNGKIRTITK